MNNPENLPLDVQEQIEWLLEHKQLASASWTILAQQTGIAAGTLSVFAGGKYQGDNERVAREVFRYRQHLQTQAELNVEAPDIPPFYLAPTAKKLQSMFAWGQRGRIVICALGPGCSKTTTAENYRDCMSNVWLITGKPSCAGLNNMQIEVLAALGERDARGTGQALSRRIRDRIANSNGLLIFDEAQHFHERAIEEIRSWHDATGIGVALIGNYNVLARIEGGNRSAAFAQLYSRVSMKLVQNLPTTSDARTLAEAWAVEDQKQTDFIVRMSQRPGGLRTLTMMMELATMVATSERRPRELSHLQEAWAQLASRPTAG
ncbi:MAG: AAA family ATPase [Sphingomicrobium sp.]